MAGKDSADSSFPASKRKNEFAEANPERNKKGQFVGSGRSAGHWMENEDSK